MYTHTHTFSVLTTTLALPEEIACLVSRWGMCSFLFSVGGSHLAQTHMGFVHAASVCVFVCASVLLNLKDLVFLVPDIPLDLTFFLALLPQDSLNPEGRVSMGEISFRAECSKVSDSAYHHAVGLWFCTHLLQEELL